MIVAGFGYRKAATQADLSATLALTGHAPDALASVTEKAQGPLAALAETLQIPLIAVDPADIERQTTPTQSNRIQQRFNTGSLAEAAALAAAGPGAQLLGPRQIGADGMATVALAQGPNS